MTVSLQTPGRRGNRLLVVCALLLLPPTGLSSIVPLMMPVDMAPLLPRGVKISTAPLEVQRGLVRLASPNLHCWIAPPNFLCLLDSPSKAPLLGRSLPVPRVPLFGARSGEMATEGSASVACGNSYWALPAAQTYSSG